MDSVGHFSRPEIFSFTHAARPELGKRRCLPVDAGTDDRRFCLPRRPLNNINILPSIASGCGRHHAAAIGDPTPLPETSRRLVCAVRTTGSQDSMELPPIFERNDVVSQGPNRLRPEMSGFPGPSPSRPPGAQISRRRVFPNEPESASLENASL
jgi:hypothetical protein